MKKTYSEIHPKKIYSVAIAAVFALSLLPLSACSSSGGENDDDDGENVLRVASWEEYIDEGGEDSYIEGSKPLYEEFEDWYREQTGKSISVKYITLQDNETMYNKIRMGDKYDLLCPSEYMIMKLAAEGRLQKFPETFYDPEIETNYYARNLSPYIKKVFDEGKTSDGSSWSEYAAGYMWGTTGFVYNPDKVKEEDVRSWKVFADTSYKKKITAKDNVRDSYFAGLGMYYEDELLALKEAYKNGTVSEADYTAELSQKMNDVSSHTMNLVKKQLENMRSNLYGLETDEGKLDVILGRLDISYQWSGDAVYILDEAESEERKTPIEYNYCIPDAASNLWFDGWTMMKGGNTEAAAMFVNFISKPENAVRNTYYIGYTSCIVGDEILDYVTETYSAEEDEEDTAEYDLSYFFGKDALLTVPAEQLKRQLFAQYPDEETMKRCVVMQYFDRDANVRANRMWNNIK